MNTHDDLLNDLRRLASVEPRQASPRIQQNILAAFRARHPRQRPKRLKLYSLIAAALITLIASLAIYKFRAAFQPAPPARLEYVYSAPGFVPLPYAESGVPLESVVVMRVQMSPFEFSSLGVIAPAAAGSAQITADLLVGQDGVPRAVRFVQ